jgi:hypothetical protein
MEFDILAYLVIITDILVASFLIWRAFAKKATLWGAARFIYVWVAAFSLYHAGIYVYSLFFNHTYEPHIVYQFLHPVVLLYILNPLLIAIIHWKGGHLL